MPVPTPTPTPSLSPALEYFYTRTDVNNPWSNFNQWFSLYRGASASAKASPTGFTFVSGGQTLDLSDLFDPSWSSKDQISFGTGYLSKAIHNPDLQTVFRSIAATPTPSPSPAQSPTPTPTVTPTISVTITPTPSISPTPASSVTPTPTPSITPTHTPTPQTSLAATTITCTGNQIVRWYPNVFQVFSDATANQTISLHQFFSRSGSSGATGSWVQFASTQPNALTSSFYPFYTPAAGPGYYQFMAIITAGGQTFSATSGVVNIAINNVAVDISNTVPVVGALSATFSSNAWPNDSVNPLLVHGFEWNNGSAWYNVGAFVPGGSVPDIQSVIHTVPSFGTYQYRAYASNCSDYNVVNTFQRTQPIYITYGSIPPTPTVTPSITPTPSTQPTPTSLYWLSTGLNLPPDQLVGNVLIKRLITVNSLGTNSFSASLYNPNNVPVYVNLTSTPTYLNSGGSITFGQNASNLPVPANGSLIITGNYNGGNAINSSEIGCTLTVTPVYAGSPTLSYRLIIPASCTWNSINSGIQSVTDTFIGQSSGSHTVYNNNSYNIVCIANINSPTNSSNSVATVWWTGSISPTNYLQQYQNVTIPANSSVTIGWFNPNSASLGSSLTLTGANQNITYIVH